MLKSFDKISFRLQALVLLLVVTSAISIGAYTLMESTKVMQGQIENKLVALRDSRHSALVQYFRSIEEDLEILAANSQVLSAMQAFRYGFGRLPREARTKRETQLRQVYNPQSPEGSEEVIKKIAAADISQYHNLHQIHHPWFEKVTNQKGYYDLFLITPDGDVVYSMFKEQDFASNLITGKWSHTGLSRVFKSSIGKPKESSIWFEDFSAYEPSNDVPAAFIGKNILHKGEAVGVLVLQMPIARINALMQVNAGMDRTGETYLVGPDNLMRSNSRFFDKSTILATEVRSSSVDLALKNKSGVHTIKNYRGEVAISAYRLFGFRGNLWALIAEKTVGEVRLPLEALRATVIFIGIGFMFFVGLIGMLFARSISVPLKELSHSIGEFRTTRRSVDLAQAGRRDEIGEIARGFQEATREISAYIEDINSAREELKQGEQALDKQRRTLQAVLENVVQAIVAVDKEMNLVACNRHFQNLLSLPDELTVPGTTTRAMVEHAAQVGFYGEGEIGELVETRMKALSSGQPLRIEINTKGGMFWYATLEPDPDGGFVMTYTDITERKQAENKLTDAYNVISSSIEYASRIQRSILPDIDLMSDVCADQFILWEPRDVVGGDMYWCRKWGEGTLIILGDCTGHGVPGAFMTLIMTGALDRAQEEVDPGQVGNLLQRMHQLAQVTLSQHEKGGESDDGMELGICYLPADKKSLYFTGARFELFELVDGGLSLTKGVKKGIGYRQTPYDQEFETVVRPLKPDHVFYMTSDGLIDQVGGENRRMYGKKRFKSLLLDIQHLRMEEQKNKIYQSLVDYQGEEARRDDVSLIGFKIGF